MDNHRRQATDGTGDGPRAEVSSIEAVAAVRELVSLMAATGVTELDLSFADVAIRLRGPGQAARPALAVPFQSEEVSLQLTVPTDTSHLVTAPMIGTFYTSPTPNDPPFVSEGDIVDAGQTVGIIEAMKIMNEIISEVAGVVVEVIAANGRAVEYGSPLVRIVPTRSDEA